MKKKSERLQTIKEIILDNRIGNQEELLARLKEKGFDLTQATLSRDLKQLKIVKVPDNDGGYIYVMPESGGIAKLIRDKVKPHASAPAGGFISISFSGNLAVIKTRPGYASGIAYDIDTDAVSDDILGTIAGDDIILVILSDHTSKTAALKVLAQFIPAINDL